MVSDQVVVFASLFKPGLRLAAAGAAVGARKVQATTLPSRYRCVSYNNNIIIIIIIIADSQPAPCCL